MHDESYVEGKLVAHVEPMVEEDEQPCLGSSINEEKIDASTIIQVAVLSDNNNPLQTYVGGTCNNVRLPLLYREREEGLSIQVLCVDQGSETR